MTTISTEKNTLLLTAQLLCTNVAFHSNERVYLSLLSFLSETRTFQTSTFQSGTFSFLHFPCNSRCYSFNTLLSSHLLASLLCVRSPWHNHIHETILSTQSQQQLLMKRCLRRKRKTVFSWV